MEILIFFFFLSLEFPHLILLRMDMDDLSSRANNFDTLGGTNYLLVGLNMLINDIISAHSGDKFLQELCPPTWDQALGTTDKQDYRT